jgi:hypothetical protein
MTTNMTTPSEPVGTKLTEHRLCEYCRWTMTTNRFMDDPVCLDCYGKLWRYLHEDV